MIDSPLQNSIVKRVTHSAIALLMVCFGAVDSFGQADVEVKGATPMARAKNLFDIGDYKNALLEYIPLLADSYEPD